MQLHELKPIHKFKKKKRIGRGGKRGTYSGKGMKGQKSRAGRRLEPVIRGIIKRYPKLRGYKFKSKVKIQNSKVKTIKKNF
jgi:large subunit ribosomal protein L15